MRIYEVKMRTLVKGLFNGVSRKQTNPITKFYTENNNKFIHSGCLVL